MVTRRYPTEARERILEKAEDLFYRRGIRAVGIDTIIAEAGVAKMSLYNHFGSKDELVAEVLRRRDRRMREWFVNTLRERAAPPDRLVSLFDVLGESFGKPEFRGCAFINAVVELADPDHPGHAVAREHKAFFLGYLTDLARDAGIPEPEPLAKQLALVVDGAITSAIISPASRPAEVARDAAVALIAAHQAAVRKRK